MTLALTIVSQHGIWQSSDMRLFDVNAGRPLRDGSVKQFRLVFQDGGVALVAFAGIGRVGTTHVSDLMFDLLRGQPRTFDQTLTALVALGNEHLIPILAAIPPDYRAHVFTIGAFSGGGPIYAEITNVDVIGRSTARVVVQPRSDFRLAWRRPAPGDGITSPAGGQFMSPADLALLGRVSARKPARDADYLALLAGITRRTGRRASRVVSPECWTWHAGPTRDPTKAPEEPTPFTWGAAMPSTSKPRTLIMGIDFEIALQEMIHAMSAYAGTLPPPGVFSDASQRGMTKAMSYAPGLRIHHATTGAKGRVVADPGPLLGSNDMEVAWDNDPTHPVMVPRSDIDADI
jgi:hypothetical protein